MLSSQRVKWFSENTGVCNIVSNVFDETDLQLLAMTIFRFCSAHHVHLEVEWLHRADNTRAD